MGTCPRIAARQLLRLPQRGGARTGVTLMRLRFLLLGKRTVQCQEMHSIQEQIFRLLDFFFIPVKSGDISP